MIDDGPYYIIVKILLFPILTVPIRLGFPQPESSNYALSAFNESESEKLPQGPSLKFDSASFGGISQNRK